MLRRATCGKEGADVEVICEIQVSRGNAVVLRESNRIQVKILLSSM